MRAWKYDTVDSTLENELSLTFLLLSLYSIHHSITGSLLVDKEKAKSKHQFQIHRTKRRNRPDVPRGDTFTFRWQITSS